MLLLQGTVGQTSLLTFHKAKLKEELLSSVFREFDWLLLWLPLRNFFLDTFPSFRNLPSFDKSKQLLLQMSALNSGVSTRSSHCWGRFKYGKHRAHFQTTHTHTAPPSDIKKVCWGRAFLKAINSQKSSSEEALAALGWDVAEVHNH